MDESARYHVRHINRVTVALGKFPMASEVPENRVAGETLEVPVGPLGGIRLVGPRRCLQR
jgi:hypothetical protein